MSDRTWWEKCGCPEEAARAIELRCRLAGSTVSPTQAFYALIGPPVLPKVPWWTWARCWIWRHWPWRVT